MTFGTATLHYFAIKDKPSSSGYGEFLNLFFKDAGIDFEYIKHDYENWDNDKDDFMKDRNVAHATLPLVEVNGKSFNKTVPVMRYLSKKLGKYTGANDEENYTLDVAADVVDDHFDAYGPLFLETDQEKLKEHFEKNTKKYLGISYADFLVYHMIDEDNFTLRDHFDLIKKDYPNVARFIEAFIQRPRLADYLAELKTEKY